ncbi:transposase [Bradyrhizobium sp. ISRA464]|uniref:transposase n=2 Tax=unclassified Bradyrhizobium TaxID=2631580 RepID=UPI0024790E37|nr:transposase [Bradyrhizobium sp. ISRA464]WGS26649.1 transposase [Bradyrhizobium sp. ISRA464]
MNEDWAHVVARLGGADALEVSARETKAFVRPREISNAVDLLRLILAYCLGERGLRLTTAWATSVGLVDISNVALLYRLRQCGDWLARLVGQALVSGAPKASRGRLIRIVDATTVPKAGTSGRNKNAVWRVHSAFDLPRERFGHFELTDERGGETLDRIPAVAGEIRLADRAYLQPERMARLLDAGADFVIRSGWKSARWLDAEGGLVDLTAELRKATAGGMIDRPIWIKRRSGVPLAMRLVAIRKPAQAAAAARRKARRTAQKGGHQLSRQTLDAADWVILVTSLKPKDFTTADIFALYRLRWRIELGFKRLKSLIGLKGPPGTDERSARPHILAHLLIILLLEPLVDELEDSPRLADAA